METFPGFKATPVCCAGVAVVAAAVDFWEAHAIFAYGEDDTGIIIGAVGSVRDDFRHTFPDLRITKALGAIRLRAFNQRVGHTLPERACVADGAWVAVGAVPIQQLCFNGAFDADERCAGVTVV